LKREWESSAFPSALGIILLIIALIVVVILNIITSGISQDTQQILGVPADDPN